MDELLKQIENILIDWPIPDQLGHIRKVIEKHITAQVEQAEREKRERIQKYIDENSIYKVEFGHYEPPLGMKWIPLKTHRIDIKEALK